MSKERELLERAIYFLEPLDWDANIQDTCQDLIKEITELLAQPEHIEDKLAMVKLEPLNAATINYYLERLGSDLKWDAGFEAGVKWTEKCHDIGVDDE